MYKKLFAEAFGTFLLVLVVQLALLNGDTAIVVPVLVALVLAFLVYTIGARSGCHINPAITIGLWSIKKMSGQEAAYYILAQLLGAAVATMALVVGSGSALSFDLVPASNLSFGAEVMGGLIFGFGVAAVALNNVNNAMSGAVVGLSLLLAIMGAVLIGSSGLINPAVALSLGEVNFAYVFGSIIGAVFGMNIYQKFIA